MGLEKDCARLCSTERAPSPAVPSGLRWRGVNPSPYLPRLLYQPAGLLAQSLGGNFNSSFSILPPALPWRCHPLLSPKLPCFLSPPRCHSPSCSRAPAMNPAPHPKGALSSDHSAALSHLHTAPSPEGCGCPLLAISPSLKPSSVAEAHPE